MKSPQPRDSRGRFLPRAKRPASLWLPDARWVAPSAADRALARAVVAAADARRTVVARPELTIVRSHTIDGTTPDRPQMHWGMLSMALIVLFVLSACMLAR